MILSTNLYDWWSTIISIPGVKTGLVIALLSAIEISPIKINPWTWIGGLIGKLVGIKKVSDKVDALDKKVDDKVDVLDKKVDELDHRVEENDIVTARVRILRFSGEVQNHQYHTKDSWDQTMIDIAKYEKYVEEHPKFKNGITEPTIEYLKQQYKERLEKHDWDVKGE